MNRNPANKLTGNGRHRTKRQRQAVRAPNAMVCRSLEDERSQRMDVGGVSYAGCLTCPCSMLKLNEASRSFECSNNPARLRSGLFEVVLGAPGCGLGIHRVSFDVVSTTPKR
jgi:hypothetical protein